MSIPQPVPFVPAQTAAFRPFEPWQKLDPSTIPRIRFVYSDAYAAGYLTVTYAAPKTGKSLLELRRLSTRLLAGVS
jgi:hypothetical protein